MISFDDLKSTFEEMGMAEEISDKEIMDMIEEADTSGDGKVSFEEYRVAMEKQEAEEGV